MITKLKLMREYQCSPVWKEDKGITESIDIEILPISSALNSQLKSWQKIYDDYYAIMEKIPGGGWSHHTVEEFEKAREELSISPLTQDMGESQGFILLGKLQNELKDKGYEVYLGE